MNEVATLQDAPRPKSVLISMADRFGMEPAAFEATLRATVVPDKSTKEQFAAFLLVAKEYDLNPLTKEIYAFPTRAGGIQPIVSIDGWMNILNSHRQFDGMEFEDVFADDGNLRAITCRIFRKDRSHPTVVTEYMSECRRDTDTWKKWPARMLRHKAAIQCARYAFGFSGLMDEDEYERLQGREAAPTPPPAPKMEATPPPAPKPQQQAPKPTGSTRTGEHKSKAELADAANQRFANPEHQASYDAQKPTEDYDPETGEVIENEDIPPELDRRPKKEAAGENSDWFANYDGWVADMEARLKAAPDDEQGEIFDTEIQPKIEDGLLMPPDQDRLKRLLRNAA